MPQLLLIYDGDCPLCRNYVAAQRLQKEFGELTLLNARDLPEQAPLLLAELQHLSSPNSFCSLCAAT